MRDRFAVIGLDRRAALDPEVVATRFREIGAEFHPDGGRSPDAGAFEEANEARRVLTDPAARLRHLLELEFGEDCLGRGGVVGDSLMPLFSEVGRVVGSAQAVAAKRGAARSELARALLAGEVASCQGQISGATTAVSQAIADRESRLPEIDARLVSDREGARVEGGQLYRELSFLRRWESQLREAFSSLF